MVEGAVEGGAVGAGVLGAELTDGSVEPATVVSAAAMPPPPSPSLSALVAATLLAGWAQVR